MENKEKLQTFIDFFNINPDSYEFDGELLIIELNKDHRYLVAPLTPLSEEEKQLRKQYYNFIMGKLKK